MHDEIPTPFLNMKFQLQLDFCGLGYALLKQILLDKEGILLLNQKLLETYCCLAVKNNQNVVHALLKPS